MKALLFCEVEKTLPIGFGKAESRGSQQEPKRHVPFPQEFHPQGTLPLVDTKHCSTGCHRNCCCSHLLYNLQTLSTQSPWCSPHFLPKLAHPQAHLHTSAPIT